MKGAKDCNFRHSGENGESYELLPFVKIGLKVDGKNGDNLILFSMSPKIHKDGCTRKDFMKTYNNSSSSNSV